MAEYLSPGVYIEETPSGAVPIQGVSTTTTGFVGQTERGPDAVSLVTSWQEYQRWFGGFLDPQKNQGYLAHAIYGFFQNGGARAFIARLSTDGAPTAAAPASELGGALGVEAIGEGLWGGRIFVRLGLAAQASLERPWFSLRVLYYDRDPLAGGPFLDPDVGANLFDRRFVAPAAREFFDNLSLDPDDGNAAIHLINPASNLIQASVAEGGYDKALSLFAELWGRMAAARFQRKKLTGVQIAALDPDDPSIALIRLSKADHAKLPAADQAEYAPVGNGDWFVPTAAPAPAYIDAQLTAGTSPVGFDAYDVERYVGSAPDLSRTETWTGLKGLEAITDIAMLCIPDQPLLDESHGGEMSTALVTQCEILGARVCLLQSLSQEKNPAVSLRPPHDTTYGAFYYPWIVVADPKTGRPVSMPPGGHIAGMIARTDLARGVFKAPANEVVLGPLMQDAGDQGPLTQKVTDGLQAMLNPRGVNCFRDFRDSQRGVRMWGARTMSSNGQWKYLNVRRLFIYVEQSILQGTQWVVFEPNDPYTWNRVVSSVSAFLTTLWRSGGLVGATPQEAFTVTCDATTMTQDDIANGRLICLIGIAPVKPAEFVIFRFSQFTAAAQS